MRALRWMVTGALVTAALALPAAASAKTVTHKCADETTKGVTASNIRVTGVTCAFARTVFLPDTVNGTFLKGWIIHEYHPSSATGNDVAINGSKRIAFYVSAAS